MFKLEITKNEYIKLKKALTEFEPNIKIELAVCDDALEKLNLCQSAPCIVYLLITPEELDLLINRLECLEADAYDSCEDEDNYNSPQKALYLQYEWMWSYLNNAEYVD